MIPVPPDKLPAMPIPDLSAVAKWPNVPACYGWLSLDRRGRWRLQGQPVAHPGLIAFINRQYGSDAAGNWFLQNGPQRVYAALDYTPWVFHLAGAAGTLTAHTGEAAGPPRAAWLDEDGSVLLAADLGAGLLDDRDFPGFFAACRGADGTPAEEAALMAILAGDDATGTTWQGLPLRPIRRADVAGRFGFNPDPQP